MDISTTLGYVSGLFLIGGYVPYVYEVIKKTTTPNRVSWFIWALSTAIILFGVKETGTHEAIWVPIADAIGCFIIFFLALFVGVGGWSRTDKIALAFCALSLIVLFITGDAFIALIMNLMIYVSGYIPTIKKAYNEPRSESFFAWSLFLIGVLLNLVTVIIGNDTGFAVWLYPIVLVLTVGTLYGVLFRRFL
jgi:hypothetical protein